MPTTTATFTLSSSDLTSSTLSLNTTNTLRKAGSPKLGLTDTSGLSRKTTTATDQYTIIPLIRHTKFILKTHLQ